MKDRLLAFLAANPARAFCLPCLAQSLEAPIRDARAVVKMALMLRAGITVRRAACERCRTVRPVTTLRT